MRWNNYAKRARMRSETTFVSAAEAAFIADISDREMNRIFDEHIVPDVLLRSESGRLFARIAAAFARFYFKTEEQLVAKLRRQVLEELTGRMLQRKDRDVILNLSRVPADLDLRVSYTSVQVDVASFVAESLDRVRQVERANALVTVDADVMAGIPVFAGSRVPLEIVTASLERGVSPERLRASYPFLTNEHVEAARIYSRVHPRRGRPRKIHPEWRLESSRLARAPRT